METDEANKTGAVDGTREGTIAGNKSAGEREGASAGRDRAYHSDAEKLGNVAGEQAGMDKAIATGKSTGEKIAENETVKKMESLSSDAININGSFVGSFERRTPRYPGDFNGANYRPSVYAVKEVLSKAYADGYNERYRFRARNAFEDQIDNYYNDAYLNQFKISYNDAYDQTYQDVLNAGINDGRNKTYGEIYPGVKTKYFNQYFSMFDLNPNRNTTDFKNAFVGLELSTYNDVYSNLWTAAHDRSMTRVFDLNIASLTEKYRAERNQSLALLYKNNAIVKFENSEMIDGGINNIAKNDGVFQPGERTLHNLTFSNFGFKDAENVKVTMQDGATFILPPIKARSKTKISGGVIYSKIPENAPLESQVKILFDVSAPLNTHDPIEAYYFDNAKNQQLKMAESKTVVVNNPFSLSGLKLTSEFIKDIKNNLSVNITNQSSRAYTDELKLVVVTSANKEVMVKPFSAFSSIDKGVMQTKNDAEVQLTDESDTYRDLNFSIKLVSGNVVLGQLPNDFVTMARAPFVDKGEAPVIFADGLKTTQDLKDLLGNMGGLAKVSVLDTSLTSLNASVLTNGLQGKSILALVYSPDGSHLIKLNNFISKSKNSAMMLIDRSGITDPLSNSLFYMPILNGALHLNFSDLGDKKVLFTNPYRTAGATGSVAMIGTLGFGEIESLMPILESLKFSSESLKKINNVVNSDSYFTPQILIKGLVLRSMAELLNVNTAYSDSKNSSWGKFIRTDKSLLINVLKESANAETTNENLGQQLAALSVRDFIDVGLYNNDVTQTRVEGLVKTAVKDVLQEMSENLSYSLTNFDQELYNKAYDNSSLHYPMAIVR